MAGNGNELRLANVAGRVHSLRRQLEMSVVAFYETVVEFKVLVEHLSPSDRDAVRDILREKGHNVQEIVSFLDRCIPAAKALESSKIVESSVHLNQA